MTTIKIIISLQSISDVITNSSSELFCTVWSDKQEIVKIIERTLKSILTDLDDSRVTRYGDYWSNINDAKELGITEDNAFQLTFDHYISISNEYLKSTIIPYLDNKLGFGNYQILFED